VTACRHVLVPVGPDESALASVTADVASRFAGSNPLSLLPMPSVETLFPTLGAFTPSAQFEALPPLAQRPDYVTAFLLHSSGSTAWPKPIYFSEHFVVASLLSRDALGEYPYGPNVRLGGMALPLFHAMGIYTYICLPLATGLRATLFRPANRSEGTGIEAVTVNTVLMAVSEVGCTCALLAPAMLVVRFLLFFRECSLHKSDPG
jgi:acyl-CoA synthetase (AMP-forming)/AMP-acid ligase II